MKKDKPLSYEDWKALGPEAATQYLADIIGLDEERQRKLLIILQHEWPQDKQKENKNENNNRKRETKTK